MLTQARYRAITCQYDRAVSWLAYSVWIVHEYQYGNHNNTYTYDTAHQNRQVDTHTLDATTKTHPAQNNGHITRVVVRACKTQTEPEYTHGY